MADRNDGGTAFPHVNPNYDGNWDKEPQRGGMTLRDWFAEHALNGICSNADISKHAYDQGVVGEKARLAFSHAAYATADAMLAERAK